MDIEMADRTGSLVKSPEPARPKVVAVIPCLNTVSFIRDVVFRAKKYVDQVIVVNDGSRDGTAEAARAAGAVVISHERNLGKGAAMKTAIQHTDADIVVFLDGDGQHDSDDIPRLVAPILQGRAHLVIGSRCLSESKISSPPFTRRFTNGLASFIISGTISFLLPLATVINRVTHPFRLTKSPPPTQQLESTQGTTPKRITDCTSGFRAIRKESWQKLSLVSQGFQIETEMIYEAAKNKLATEEVPISCNWNSNTSTLSIFRDGLRTLKLLGKKLIKDALRSQQPKQ